MTILTPDKENALYVAGLSLPIMDDNPDYPALVIGNFILGGGGLSSRIADRLRQKDGLSYGARSILRREPARSQSRPGRSTRSITRSTSPRLFRPLTKSCVRLLNDGVMAAELEGAKNGYLQQQQQHAHERYGNYRCAYRKICSWGGQCSSRPTSSKRSRT